MAGAPQLPLPCSLCCPVVHLQSWYGLAASLHKPLTPPVSPRSWLRTPGFSLLLAPLLEASGMAPCELAASGTYLAALLLAAVSPRCALPISFTL